MSNATSRGAPGYRKRVNSPGQSVSVLKQSKERIINESIRRR